jgi:tetratricopeptide (TPR) repeat protein
METILLAQKITDFEQRLPDAQDLETAKQLHKEIEGLRPELEIFPDDHPLRFRWVKLLVAILIRLGRINNYENANQAMSLDYYKLAEQENIDWKQKLGENFQFDFQMFNWKTRINIAIIYSEMGESDKAEGLLFDLNDELENAIESVDEQSQEIYDLEAIVKNAILFEVALPYFDEEDGIEAWEPIMLDMINKLTNRAEDRMEGTYLLSPKRRAEIWINCAEAFNRMGRRNNQGDFERAIGYLEKLEGLTDFIDISLLTHGRIQKAEIYQAQGMFEKAIPILESSIMNNDVDTFRRCYAAYYLGQVYQKLGEKDAEKSIYRRAMEIYKSNPDDVPQELFNDIEKALALLE